ncbi:MAG TPA: hypothetical protein VK949_04070 [Methylotenera sp.]|nr:hypothetical protein [Methylotenera sp.]
MTQITKLRLKLAARLFVFTWFFIGGISHFVITDFYLRIMPPYIPFHLACIYISGAFELLGAFGLWVKPWRSFAGYGLMLLTAVVTLANVQMYQTSEMFPTIPVWVLIIRFPTQVLLLWLIWWSSRPDVDTTT